MNLTLDNIMNIYPNTDDSILKNYVDPINKVLAKYNINTIDRVSMFMAQMGEESQELQSVSENLNYSGQRLLQVFPRYFRGVNVANYSHNREKIANRVYANRMGNGDEASGDGYKYRGRGGIQLTGKVNYEDFAADMNMSVDDAITYISTYEGTIMVAGWFWNKNNLNVLADRKDILMCTRRINGGTNGLSQREAIYHDALDELTP